MLVLTYERVDFIAINKAAESLGCIMSPLRLFCSLKVRLQCTLLLQWQNFSVPRRLFCL